MGDDWLLFVSGGKFPPTDLDEALPGSVTGSSPSEEQRYFPPVPPTAGYRRRAFPTTREHGVASSGRIVGGGVRIDPPRARAEADRRFDFRHYLRHQGFASAAAACLCSLVEAGTGPSPSRCSG
jgi:hypothetical protein